MSALECFVKQALGEQGALWDEGEGGGSAEQGQHLTGEVSVTLTPASSYNPNVCVTILVISCFVSSQYRALPPVVRDHLTRVAHYPHTTQKP